MGHELTFSTVKGGVETGGDLEAVSTLHHHPFIGVGGGGGGACEAASRVEVESPTMVASASLSEAAR